MAQLLHHFHFRRAIVSQPHARNGGAIPSRARLTRSGKAGVPASRFPAAGCPQNRKMPEQPHTFFTPTRDAPASRLWPRPTLTSTERLRPSLNEGSSHESEWDGLGSGRPVGQRSSTRCAKPAPVVWPGAAHAEKASHVFHTHLQRPPCILKWHGQKEHSKKKPGESDVKGLSPSRQINPRYAGPW